jgi:hypothetical protein
MDSITSYFGSIKFLSWGADIHLEWVGLLVCALISICVVRRAFPNLFKAHLLFSKKKMVVVE